jgi:hypothetical protein
LFQDTRQQLFHALCFIQGWDEYRGLRPIHEKQTLLDSRARTIGKA